MQPPARSQRAVLRRATAADHARLDAGFPEGLATPDDYRAYLLGLHALVRDADSALAAAALSPAWRRWPQRQRLDWLQCDLDWHRLAALPPSPPAPLGGDAAAAGLLYVLEGSTLGARLLAADATRLGHGAGTGAEFLGRHTGDGAARRWRTFVAALDDAGFDATGEAAMFESASATFNRAADGFRHARNWIGERRPWTD